jgi:tetratricopeptide (TPR) repeat protein
MTPCPSDDELRRLLGGELVADSLTNHTDECAACQARLERLLEDPAASRWRSLLARTAPIADPAQLAATRLQSTVSFKPTEEGLLRRLKGHAQHRKAPVPAPSGYEVLQELGRGGMGVVYKARQTALKRLVALKVVGSGSWAGAEELARFRAEAEAVAHLHHPNIVQIYEVGEHEGRPFFSLEFVDGGSLADRLDGTPSPPRASAELVRTLALAMHAAHERGIVHRDLKPANILLEFSCDPSGSASALPDGSRLNDVVPKIADFGLAKRLGGDSHLTHTGSIIGTPSYMAPEQAGGQVHAIGPAADVYALGAILYELLTGWPPFNGATALETLQQVQSQTPVAPTRLQPKVPRDLETICLKCLEKEPHKRYATARALADDLGHFLAGEPIVARPATVWERTRKWAKRRPALAGLVFVLVAAPVILLGMGLWSYFELSASAAKLKQRNRDANEAVEDMYTKVAEEWLADEPQKDPLQKEFLEKALNYYERLTHEDSTDPEARRGAARAWFRVGQLRRIFRQTAEAAAAYARAIAIQEKLCEQFPAERVYRQDLANSYNWMGELRRDSRGSLADAESYYQKALALQQRLVGEEPGEADYRRDLARSRSNLGLVKMDTNRSDEAGSDFDRAVDLLEQLLRESPKNDVRHELARTLTNRGVFRRTHKRTEDAEADYRWAITLLQEVRRSGRFRVSCEYNLAILHVDLGNILLDKEDHDQALAELDQAEEILIRLVEDFPGRAHFRKKLARTYNSRGSALAETGEERPAEEDLRKAELLLRKLVVEDADEPEYLADLGKCVGNLGLLRFQQDNLAAADSHFREAVSLLGAARDRNPQRLDYLEALRDHWQNLAETRVRLGDCPGAVEAAVALAEVFPYRALGHYYGACFIARCVPLEEKAGDSNNAAHHADQAAALLRKALETHLKGGERLAKEEEPFERLAQRPGWAKLLHALPQRP